MAFRADFRAAEKEDLLLSLPLHILVLRYGPQ